MQQEQKEKEKWAKYGNMAKQKTETIKEKMVEEQINKRVLQSGTHTLNAWEEESKARQTYTHTTARQECFNF